MEAETGNTQEVITDQRTNIRTENTQEAITDQRTIRTGKAGTETEKTDTTLLQVPLQDWLLLVSLHNFMATETENTQIEEMTTDQRTNTRTGKRDNTETTMESLEAALLPQEEKTGQKDLKDSRETMVL